MAHRGGDGASRLAGTAAFPAGDARCAWSVHALRVPSARASGSAHGNFPPWHVYEKEAVVSRLSTYLSFVRFSHSVFALPFALTGALLASRQQAVTWRQ